MRNVTTAILLATAGLLPGCIFGGSDLDGGEPANTYTNGDPNNDIADANDTPDAVEVDVGAPDASPPPDMSPQNIVVRDMDRPDGPAPNNWQLGGHRSRVHVSWVGRLGMPISNFVVPVRLPEGAGPGAVAVSPTGAVFNAERDGDAVWVEIPDFGAEGEFWVYFDGPEETVPSPWSSYIGVWHFTEANRDADSSISNNAMSGVNNVTLGVVGTAAEMPDGPGAGNLLSAPIPATVFQSDATVEMWVRLGPGNQNIQNLIFSRQDAMLRRFALAWSDPRTMYLVLNGSGEPVAVTQIMNPGANGEMVHIALVSKATQPEIILMLNGVEAARVTPTDDTWTASDQTFAFGANWNGGGMIDEVRVSQTIRDPHYLNAVVQSYKPEFFQVSPVMPRP